MLSIEQLAADGLAERRDELVALYAEVYLDRLSDPFFSSGRFWERVLFYASRSGFSLILGRLDGELIGCAMGCPLSAGSTWWQGLPDEIDPDLLTETGRRTFALTYLMVRESWRRRGYAHQLHDALLRDRPEERATLYVLPDNRPALAAYHSWGWYELGDRAPFDDSPRYRALLLELR
jgi:ribosomal protein S18 acetylase RimI-like enzyme